MFYRYKYQLGVRIAKYLIKKGKPLQMPFFSGIYQTFFTDIRKNIVYVPPEYSKLVKLHNDKHKALIETSTKLDELKEKHIDLSKKYSKLVRSK